jgi:uncharacterized membrane protein YcaP (DUF421 family)
MFVSRASNRPRRGIFLMSPSCRRTEIEEMDMFETIIVLALCGVFAGPLAAAAFTRS